MHMPDIQRSAGATVLAPFNRQLTPFNGQANQCSQLCNHDEAGNLQVILLTPNGQGGPGEFCHHAGAPVQSP